VIPVIVQARMGSSRLPGKVMKKIQDKNLLQYMINQIQACKRVSEIIIATTDRKEDDKIASLARMTGLKVFRGKSDDVLDRFHSCAEEEQVKSLVRLSADSPFIDYNIIDLCISKFEESDVDYLSNTIKKKNNTWIEGTNGFPIGMAVEVFTFDALKKAWKQAKKSSEREHVTEYIFHNPSLFRLDSIENNEDLSDQRLVVDYSEDLELASKIITSFSEGEIFTIKKIKDFFSKNPKMKMINSMHKKMDDI